MKNDGRRPQHLALLLVLTLVASACSSLGGTACSVCRDEDFGFDSIAEIAPASAGRMLVVLLSGDRGWNDMDRKFAEQFQSEGYGIVGLDMPSYLRNRKSPGQIEGDFTRLTTSYMRRWQSQGVLVIGYSRGAGVLPFILTRIPAELKRQIRGAAFIGLDPQIDFKVPRKILLLWQPADERNIPVLPEVEKLRDIKLICVRGRSDRNSLCRQLPPGFATQLVRGGGHRLRGNHRELARTIERLTR